MEEQKLDSKYSYLVIYLFTIPCWNWSLWLQTTHSLSYSFKSQKSDVGQFTSFQSLSRVQLFATPWTAARQASLSITNSWSLLKLMSIESVMPSNHLIICHPHHLLPSIFPSIRVFSSEWPFTSDSQNIGASAWASVLPMNIQDWFPLGLTGLILQSQGLSRVFFSTTLRKHPCWRSGV